MARKFVAASLQHLTNGTALLTAAPMTWAAWVWHDPTAGAIQVAYCIGGTTGNNAFVGFKNSSGWNANVVDNVSGGTSGTKSIPDPQRARWIHVASVYTNSGAACDSQTAYVDGVASAANVVSRTPTVANLDETTIGVRKLAGAKSLYWDGLIADAGLWNIALTGGEVLLLAKNVSPLTVRRGSLVDSWPLDGRTGTEASIGGTHAMTNSGSTVGVPRRRFQPSLGPYVLATVDLNVTGAKLKLNGGIFDLNQRTAGDAGGALWRRRRR